MVSKICPRCDYTAKLSDPFYKGYGAISRADNKTQICSNCGVEEGYEQFIYGEVTPKSAWPVYK